MVDGVFRRVLSSMKVNARRYNLIGDVDGLLRRYRDTGDISYAVEAVNLIRHDIDLSREARF